MTTNDTGLLDIRWLKSFYEEGTWTPALAGDGAAPGTFTYNASFTGGDYTRIGKRVLYSGRVLITAITVAPTAGSNMFITLPTVYTVATSAFSIAGTGVISWWKGVTFPGGFTQLGGYVVNATSRLYLGRSGSGAVAANVLTGEIGLIGGQIDLIFGGSYEVA